MMNRCSSSLALGRNYKARGISICPQWEDFTVFLRDMGERPPGTTLDRIDNNGNYTPENCRWATTAQQARNTTRSQLIFHEGRNWNICDLADHLGMKRQTLWCRLSRYGWTVERAINTPVRGKS
jgi:transcriptional regulator with GAF, ATPase, and Fis domain